MQAAPSISATRGAASGSWPTLAGTCPPPPPERDIMAFEITKKFVINAPASQVREFLTDPKRVARCLPGAAVGDKLDEKTFAGTMTVKVGPVSSSYKGKVVFERLDAAAHTAEIAAVGQDVRGKGGADMHMTSSLRELGASETEVTAV